MRTIFALFIGLIFLVSCNLFQKYEGYSKTKTGIYYKLHYIGEEVNPPTPGNYVTADISYYTMDDSLFFNGYRTFQLTRPEFQGSIDECFLMLSAGDSASFIINGEKFFTQTLGTGLPRFIEPGSHIKVSLRLDEIRTEAQYENDKAEFLKWIEDFGEYEKYVLSKFIKEEKIDVTPNDEGMYFIKVHEGTGKPVEPGDLITINYEGKFLNGKFFDSTKKRQQPLEFIYGSEMQVIPGIEKAIGKMREGDKVVIILPSDLAWGEKGSSTGIIPPFTSVIYELELIRAVSRTAEEKTTE